MTIDPFTEVLSLTNAEAVVTGGFTAGGPWAIRFPAREKIKFFAVVKGNCWVTLDGVPEPIFFETGDVGLLSVPRGSIVASAPDIEPIGAMELFSGKGRIWRRSVMVMTLPISAAMSCSIRSEDG